MCCGCRAGCISKRFNTWGGAVWGFAFALGEGISGDPTAPPGHRGGSLCSIRTLGPLPDPLELVRR